MPCSWAEEHVVGVLWPPQSKRGQQRRAVRRLRVRQQETRAQDFEKEAGSWQSPHCMESWESSDGIKALLFHTLLPVPQQDRRDKQSQGTTDFLQSPEMGMDEVQPNTKVLSCIACGSQSCPFPQTHLKRITRAPRRHLSRSQPSC